MKRWARQQRVEHPSRRAVLDALAWSADDHGHCAELSVREIVESTGWHRNTVLRALDALRAAPLIKEAGRGRHGTVIYDLVLDGDSSTTSSTSTSTTVVPALVLVPDADQHHRGTGTSTTVVHPVTKELEQQQLPHTLAPVPAPAPAHEAASVVERILSTLRRTRLTVDEVSIDQIVMRHADRLDDLDAALTEVLALAGDPAYTEPKGGAAMMLIYQLRRQQTGAAPTPARRGRTTPARAAADDERWSKYDRAAGL